ncbi:alpha/beta hydrolase [Acholeplasma manati]|uniref:Alpha/beta hydrolase n=1 Tax=Paracholeplasma manati TaxID=591373 RepID=A0ABT2Y5D0_9MOLU|nr:alpha/beta hydrolase [Paracholeplasma manati]MCV2231954.1 alpha/beta hydrolase [Paracholeplasma manati]
MKHIYQKGDTHTLILLHGTGGDENDLIPLAKMVSPQSSILSIRGNVLENGMPRFFRRLAMGVFDQENLKEETRNLYHFLLEAAQTYQFDLNKSTIIGFSNGANIAISLLFTYNNPVGQAILLRPMIPNEVILSKSLNQTDVIIITGNYDTIVPPAHGQRLTTLFQGLQANTTLFQLDATHRLTEEDVKIIKENIKK